MADDKRRRGTTRLYHPSPNCPCQDCFLEFRAGEQPMHPNCRCFSVEPRGLFHDMPKAGPRDRSIYQGEWTPSALVDLLDMPEPDRSVLIAVIGGMSSPEPE